MHKAFPLPVIRVPTGRTTSHCQVVITLEDPIINSFQQVVSELVPASSSSTTTTDTTSDETGTKSGRTVTLTAEDIQKKKNDVKARTTLHLSFPDEHQLRFNKYKTARELWAAILKTFGGNEATKKTNKNLLMQQYGNFKVEGSETLESDLDTTSLDDLYNHLKVYESEVQKKTEPNSQNMALSLQQNTAAEMKMINEDDMEEMDIKWNMELLSMRADKFWKKTRKKISIQGLDVAGFDKSKSYMANDEEDHEFVADEVAPIEFALMANTNAKSKKLKTLKEEKEGVDGKLVGLLKASKDLDNLIKRQRSDKNKDGLGYSAVPPPPAQLYLSPKKDLSWTGLPECPDFVMKKKACFNCVDFNHLAYDCRKRGSSQNNIDDKGYWDSGCSRHMTGNISYLSDYEPFDGGYVSFVQGGCKITGKGTTKTGFFKPFGCHVMILNTLDNLGKFEEKGDEVDAGTISTNLSGTKDAARQEVKKYVSSLRYIALPNWAHDALLEFSSSKPQDHCSTKVPEGSGNLNPTASTSNPPADQMETLTVETPIPTVSSPVPIAYSTDSQEPLNKSNRVVADISNMETAITASPTPTLRIHKDHPKSQIIGLMDTPIQTRNKSKKDLESLAKVYKVEKSMYGLHQAPRAWYGTLSKYLLKMVFKRLCREFEALMHEKFQMSAMGELNFFLGLQVLQKEDVIYLLQDKYVGDILKKFRYSEVRSSNTQWTRRILGEKTRLEKMHQVTPKECHLHAVKRIFRYLKGHPKLGLWYPKESPFDLVAYSDSDYDGATQDRK
uniref:Retrovirus-related Pol polyprotein from transposon TNT 1-94-like beta-barrel domain-containing protein n=1 Tax=Tanacetum cinerariifolium TaxID=118510 RepID=A0A6L2L1L2_TANCI|nr:hypothetical protein [Tanacetum cinerariifolium]